MSGLPPAEPTGLDVTRAWIAEALLSLQTALPGVVQRYDAATQTADVLPAIRTMVLQPDGSFLQEDPPVIPSVPVVFPRCGPFALTFPVAVGDCVLLVFCAADLGPWRVGDGSLSNPGDLRRHHASNAVALPGLYPRGQALAHAPAGGGSMVLGRDTASADGGTLEVATDGTITLNKGTLKVARETDGLNVGTLVATAGPWPVVFTYVPGTAGVVPPAPPGGVALTGVIASGQGAAKVKA